MCVTFTKHWNGYVYRNDNASTWTVRRYGKLHTDYYLHRWMDYFWNTSIKWIFSVNLTMKTEERGRGRKRRRLLKAWYIIAQNLFSMTWTDFIWTKCCFDENYHGLRLRLRSTKTTHRIRSNLMKKLCGCHQKKSQLIAYSKWPRDGESCVYDFKIMKSICLELLVINLKWIKQEHRDDNQSYSSVIFIRKS